MTMKELIKLVLCYKEGRNALALVVGGCLAAIALVTFFEQTAVVSMLEMGLSVLVFMATTRFAQVVRAVYEKHNPQPQDKKKR